jgi:hypothetical protein
MIVVYLLVACFAYILLGLVFTAIGVRTNPRRPWDDCDVLMTMTLWPVVLGFGIVAVVAQVVGHFARRLGGRKQ